GNAVNCSIALGKMGIPCEMIVKVGDDALGEFVIAEASRHNVGTRGVIRGRGIHTPYTFVCVMPGGQRSFFHTMGANGTLTYAEIDQSIIRGARFCFVTGTMVMATFDGPETARLLRDVQAAG